MGLKTKFFYILILSFITNTSFASLVFEPYYGGNLIFSKNFNTYQNYGGRGSVSFGNLLLGVDYGIGKFQDITTSGYSSYTDEFKRTKMGIFLSYCLDRYCEIDKTLYVPSRTMFHPFRANKYRIWFNYILNIQDKVSSSGGAYEMNEILKGKAFEVGISNKLFFALSGYMAFRYIKLDQIQRTTGDIDALVGNNNISEIEVGIGLPMSFF